MDAFTNLEVWKRGCRLSVELYEALRDCREFGLRDQMTRAAVSVPSNIAEGHERGSVPDFIRFLRIAKGSSAELRTQIYIAQRIDVLSKDLAEKFASEAEQISRMLQALINSLRVHIDGK